MWRQRLATNRIARPFLRAPHLLPGRAELADLGGWRQGASLHRGLERGGYTMLGPRTARHLLRLAKDVERRKVPGDVVDCGVWNGGSTILLASGAPSRRIWAFDSFQGMPETTAADGEIAARWVGKLVGSEQRVREGFRRYGLENPLEIVPGWFDQTLPEHADRIESIAILHVDADWYDSVTLALRTLYPKLSPGGWVAVDDYKMWEGARSAVDEFRGEQGIDAPLIDHHHWQKPSSG